MSDRRFSNSDEKCQKCGIWQVMFPCKTKKMKQDEEIVTDFLGSVLLWFLLLEFILWVFLLAVKYSEIIFYYFSTIF